MANDPAMWSRTFARKLGALLGFPTAMPGTVESSIPKEAATLLDELTEDLRYLPGEQWNWTERLTQFLNHQEAPALVAAVERLREVRSYVAFLRSRHGSQQPADESDEWTEEDLREFSNETFCRLDETDPYEWPGLPVGSEEKK